MNWVTTTKQGDTWDSLAHDIYGDANLADVLIQANPSYMRMIYMPVGLSIIVPQMPAGKTSSPLPPWARG